MGLGRVMGMVPGVGHRLRIGQAAQEQEADGQADGDGFEGASREHRGNTNDRYSLCQVTATWRLVTPVRRMTRFETGLSRTDHFYGV